MLSRGLIRMQSLLDSQMTVYILLIGHFVVLCDYCERLASPCHFVRLVVLGEEGG